MRGHIKNWNEKRGFGFIKADDGRDVFTHITAIIGGMTPSQGDVVEFEIEKAPKGEQARSVYLK